MISKNGKDNLQASLYETRIKMERAEVILSNLLALQHTSEDKFTIPFDDVIASLETALYFLQQ